MRNLEWQSEAWAEYVEIQQTEKTKLRKVNSLLKDIMRNGYQCTEVVTVIACGDHCSDH